MAPFVDQLDCVPQTHHLGAVRVDSPALHLHDLDPLRVDRRDVAVKKTAGEVVVDREDALARVVIDLLDLRIQPFVGGEPTYSCAGPEDAERRAVVTHRAPCDPVANYAQQAQQGLLNLHRMLDSVRVPLRRRDGRNVPRDLRGKLPAS